MLLIGINRPAKLNGFTPAMLRELGQACTRLGNAMLHLLTGDELLVVTITLHTI